MSYYHITINNQAITLCTIILSWGNCQYKHLPVGVRNSLEIIQEKMNEMFRGFEFIQSYIDDLLITIQGDWSNHLVNWN